MGSVPASPTKVAGLNRSSALSTWKAREDRYKCDLIEGFPADETISFYYNASGDEGGGPGGEEEIMISKVEVEPLASTPEEGVEEEAEPLASEGGRARSSHQVRDSRSQARA